MKIRNGFVSNSSSSSFVLKKSDLTEAQINFIRRHVEVVEAAFNNLGSIAMDADSDGLAQRIRTQCGRFDGAEGRYDGYDAPGWYLEGWYIEETEDTIGAHTSMANFDMATFLECIGAPIPMFED